MLEATVQVFAQHVISNSSQSKNEVRDQYGIRTTGRLAIDDSVRWDRNGHFEPTLPVGSNLIDQVSRSSVLDLHRHRGHDSARIGDCQTDPMRRIAGHGRAL